MPVTPQTLVDQLKRDEGQILHAYQDSLGYWTIGVGRLIDARRGGGITPSESDYLLANDIESKRQELYQALPWTATMDEVRRAVLLNMAFNLGVAGLLAFKQTLAHVQRGEWPNAAAEMLQSTWATQVGDRAHRLAQQLESGEWV